MRPGGSPPSQWKRDKRVKKRANLRSGDLVFFDGNKNGKLQPTDHVGIYPGNGHLIHASNYFGEVVEGKMQKIDGCWGAKKMTRLRETLRDIQLIRITTVIPSSTVFDQYEVGIMLYAEGCSAEDVGQTEIGGGKPLTAFRVPPYNVRNSRYTA